jgi:hypothetical protein
MSKVVHRLKAQAHTFSSLGSLGSGSEFLSLWATLIMRDKQLLLIKVIIKEQHKEKQLPNT